MQPYEPRVYNPRPQCVQTRGRVHLVLGLPSQGVGADLVRLATTSGSKHLAWSTQPWALGAVPRAWLQLQDERVYRSVNLGCTNMQGRVCIPERLASRPDRCGLVSQPLGLETHMVGSADPTKMKNEKNNNYYHYYYC